MTTSTQEQNVNFMAKLKVSRSDPSLPLLQGEVSRRDGGDKKGGLKNISKVGKFQGAMWASHPTISTKINTT